MGEYTQVSGKTLDFGLQGIDKYSQPTGKTVDFELIEATTISLSESISFDEVYGREVNYSRTNSEVVAFNDADIRQLERSLAETAFLNDSASKLTKKPVSEIFSLDETYARVGDFFRNYNEDFTTDAFTEIFAVVRLDEQLTFNDSDIREVEKFLLEGFSANDNYSRTGTFFREYEGNFSLNDFLETAKARFVAVTETFGVDDTTELLTVVRLDEQVTLDDTFSRVGDFFRNYTETVALDGDLEFLMRRQLNESFSLDTFAPITTVVELDEVLTFDDTVTKRTVKSLDETLAFDDSIRNRDLFAVRTERIGLDDADIRELQRTLEEAIGANDVYNRTGEFFRTVDESFSLDDADTKFLIKVLDTETLGVADRNVNFQIEKVLNDGFSAAEVFITDADYFRNYSEIFNITDQKDLIKTLFREFDETLTVDEVLSKQIQKVFEETLSVDDVFSQFFSEGPGTPPYYLRNSIVQANSLQNQFATKSIQNLFESLSIQNSLGDQEQT